MLKHYLSGGDFSPLLVGKTSFDHLSILSELKERELIHAPELLPVEHQSPAENDPILDGIRPQRPALIAVTHGLRTILFSKSLMHLTDILFC